jgi:hypothetical protein
MVPVPVLAFLHFGPIPVLARYITSTGTVPVPVSAFMHFGPVPVLARYITGMGIKWCPYRDWHICTLVQYQYGRGPLPALALNGASTGNVNEPYAKYHKIYASNSVVPPLLGALLELVICANWYPVV